jgi:hypothetical protein
MAFIDLDEYIFSENSSLKTVLDKNDKDIAGILMRCQWFGCSFGAQYDVETFYKKLIFRKANCEGHRPGTGPKMIVKPKNVDVYAIHRVIKSTKETIVMKPENLKFNHFFSLTNNNDSDYGGTNVTRYRKKNKNTCDCMVFDEIQDTKFSQFCSSLFEEHKKFIFVSIPKNGSQSIHKMWNIPMKDHSKISDVGIFDNHCRAEVLKKRYNDFDSRFKFCFVRNPWERLYSWYVYHKDVYKIDIYTKQTFESWILNGCKHHWGPQNGTRYRLLKKSPLDQFEFIYDKNGNCLVDYIGKMETFEEDLKMICEKLGVECPSVEHKNKSKSEDWKEHYTPEMIEYVRKRFKKDIELFGY